MQGVYKFRKVNGLRREVFLVHPENQDHTGRKFNDRLVLVIVVVIGRRTRLRFGCRLPHDDSQVRPLGMPLQRTVLRLKENFMVNFFGCPTGQIEKVNLTSNLRELPFASGLARTCLLRKGHQQI
jgi:hypothetical protein